MTESTGERHRDFDRYLTFIDAIVAIAITLLVLPLVDLTVGLSGSHGESVTHLLDKHQVEIWSFLLSFVVISRLWFSQHAAVRTVLLYEPHVAQVLGLWTLTIVFLPFPTSLVAHAGHEAITKILYIGTIAASMAVLAVLERVIAAHPEITTGEGAPDTGPVIVNTILTLLALAITLIVPGTSYYPMLLLLLEAPIRHLRARWRH